MSIDIDLNMDKDIDLVYGMEGGFDYTTSLKGVYRLSTWLLCVMLSSWTIVATHYPSIHAIPRQLLSSSMYNRHHQRHVLKTLSTSSSIHIHTIHAHRIETSRINVSPY